MTNSAVYCVTTVFNKVSILGSKLSLALEERSQTIPMGCLPGAEFNGKSCSKPGQRSHRAIFTQMLPRKTFPFSRVVNISSEADARW